jgi:hypothetical protein
MFKKNVEVIKTHGTPRSDKWGGVRKLWLKEHGTCAACGTDKNLQVHHVIAFHTDKEKELDPSNFITLCEGMERNCHRFIGHLENFQSINEKSREDAAYWLSKIAHRPKWEKDAWVNQ